jgi:hypothetical protein
MEKRKEKKTKKKTKVKRKETKKTTKKRPAVGEEAEAPTSVAPPHVQKP